MPDCDPVYRDTYMRVFVSDFSGKGGAAEDRYPGCPVLYTQSILTYPSNISLSCTQ